MKGNFKKLFRKFCLNGTVLGLKYFYLYTDRVSRCFWVAVTAYTAYLACLLTYKLYMRFEETPTRVAIENQYEEVSSLPWPAVTICSPNQMTLSAMRHFAATLVDGNHTIDLEKALPQLLSFYQIVEFDENTLSHLQNLIDLNRYTLTDVIAMLPQACDQFLLACFFRKDAVMGCRGIFRPILTTHGMCCSFNSMYYYNKKRFRNERIRDFKPFNVERTGIHNALVIVMDFNPADALDGTIVRAGSTRVMFHDWTEFPADDESGLVMPQTESFHSIHATYTYCSDDVKELSPWSRDCYFEHEHHLPYFYTYRNSDCDTVCFVKAVEEICHCVLLFVPHLHMQLACNATSLPCVNHMRMQLHEWEEKQNCECPRDCDFRRYRVDTVMGNLQGLSFVPRNFGDLTFNTSTSVMNFFFQTPAYVKQKQETVMSLTTLVANLGGVFGLFLGCSVITLFEAIFYLQTALRNCLRAKIKRTTQVCPLNHGHISFHM